MSIHPDPKINRLNIFGEPLASCCFDPITGYFRNGFCHTSTTDLGQHTVCAQMSSDFLNFSQKLGNDLITPLPELDFPGLKPGDFWCICVERWVEAYELGQAPKLKLHSCHQSILNYVPLHVLMEYSVA
ncbi:DUF2237 domain-containing protein [Acinetobacter sp. ESL0695]|uniref:DUF2237 family protein n=1 Tax=Acinetobacter sp. ESL0695 TaxID=2983215 RepID=UPI0023F0E48C|nr:DUF2237 domain-containing protein [Acinetobacter sp. ESL0695]WEV47988.1 DUF2237 domain-containing protein [Acinetobacter sp. ESL0695]